MTAIELANLALQKIGVTLGIASLDEASREAYTAGAQYDHLLRVVLRTFNWPFATKYQTLTLTGGTVWDDDWADYVQAWSASDTYAVGDVVQVSSLLYYANAASTNQTPPNASYWDPAADTDTEPPESVAGGDWFYSYRWPSDCVRARRLVPEETGRKWNRTPIPFRVGRDANQRLIYTDRQDAVLEYTTLDCDALWADDLFLDAFTWRMAQAFAPAHSRNGVTASECAKWYEYALNRAKQAALDEQEVEKSPGDAEWTEAR
jgi:hypothetical protein